MDATRWHFHADAAVDLAVLPFEVPDWASARYFETRYALTPLKAVEKDIGAGDMVYIVGVFYLLHGTKKNRPYVYPGHIAVFEDDEPIPIRGTDGRMEYTTGHLVAAQTLPGASGSPVFVRRTIRLDVADHNDPSTLVKAWVHGTVWLLGMWQGAWHGRPLESLGLDVRAGITVPVGTGIVVPAKQILELLNAPELRRERAAVADSDADTGGILPENQDGAAL
jgi:hypothetical protein